MTEIAPSENLLWQRTLLLSCDSVDEHDLMTLRRRVSLAENDKFEFDENDKF